MKTLHVLNGDATLRPFSETRLGGEAVVWREMLSEGPVKADVRSDEELWAIRRDWIHREYGYKSPGSYDEMVVREFEQLTRYAEFDEVVFWFENDLFCQINLVFLLACFHRVPLGSTRLRQVSIDRHPDVPGFKGLGQLNSAQLATLYLRAEDLTDYDLAYAGRVWQSYAGPDPLAVQRLLDVPAGRLRFLPDALRAHLQRFPHRDNGLSLIEKQLVSILAEGPMPEQELIRRFLHQDSVYGIGDWSVEWYIRQGQPHLFVRQGDLVELAPGSANVVMGHRQRPPADRWLGGYHQTALSPYRWDGEQLI